MSRVRWTGVLVLWAVACGTQDYEVGKAGTGSGTDGASGGDLVDASCSPACGVTEICVAGKCECRAGLRECGGGCVDTRSDPAFCREGECRRSCDGSTCDGLCAQLDDDPFNCGSCGNVCAADELCTEGECVGFTVPNCAVCPCESCGEDMRCCEEVLESHPVVCLAGEECP